MKWVLVFVLIKMSANVNVDSWIVDKPFETMEECFRMRELLLIEVGGKDGYYPPGSQAICIRVEE